MTGCGGATQPGGVQPTALHTSVGQLAQSNAANQQLAAPGINYAQVNKNHPSQDWNIHDQLVSARIFDPMPDANIKQHRYGREILTNYCLLLWHRA